MGPIATSFGFAALIAVAVAGLSGRRHPSFWAALMLLGFWALANVTGSWTDPVADAVGFYVAYAIVFSFPKCRWCWGLLAVFAIQLVTHVVFLIEEDSYWRQLTLNVCFAIQLVLVSVPGGIVGLRRIRDSWARVHHSRPVPDPAFYQGQEEEKATASRAVEVAPIPPYRR